MQLLCRGPHRDVDRLDQRQEQRNRKEVIDYISNTIRNSLMGVLQAYDSDSNV